jgi:flagellar biosynthesis protein FliP
MLRTGFVRIVVVLASLRTALVSQCCRQSGDLGLALMLSSCQWPPPIQDDQRTAMQPYLEGDIDIDEAFAIGVDPSDPLCSTGWGK